LATTLSTSCLAPRGTFIAVREFCVSLGARDTTWRRLPSRVTTLALLRLRVLAGNRGTLARLSWPTPTC
jgi:hypothetical protein